MHNFLCSNKDSTVDDETSRWCGVWLRGSSCTHPGGGEGRIDHFTVVCLVAWPLNESEAGGDLVLIETSLLFLRKFLLISMRTESA